MLWECEYNHSGHQFSYCRKCTKVAFIPITEKTAVFTNKMEFLAPSKRTKIDLQHKTHTFCLYQDPPEYIEKD